MPIWICRASGVTLMQLLVDASCVNGDKPMALLQHGQTRRKRILSIKEDLGESMKNLDDFLLGPTTLGMLPMGTLHSTADGESPRRTSNRPFDDPKRMVSRRSIRAPFWGTLVGHREAAPQSTMMLRVEGTKNATNSSLASSNLTGIANDTVNGTANDVSASIAKGRKGKGGKGSKGKGLLGQPPENLKLDCSTSNAKLSGGTLRLDCSVVASPTSTTNVSAEEMSSGTENATNLTSNSSGNATVNTSGNVTENTENNSGNIAQMNGSAVHNSSSDDNASGAATNSSGNSSGNNTGSTAVGNASIVSTAGNSSDDGVGAATNSSGNSSGNNTGSTAVGNASIVSTAGNSSDVGVGAATNSSGSASKNNNGSSDVSNTSTISRDSSSSDEAIGTVSSTETITDSALTSNPTGTSSSNDMVTDSAPTSNPIGASSSDEEKTTEAEKQDSWHYGWLSWVPFIDR